MEYKIFLGPRKSSSAVGKKGGQLKIVEDNVQHWLTGAWPGDSCYDTNYGHMMAISQIVLRQTPNLGHISVSSEVFL